MQVDNSGHHIYKSPFGPPRVYRELEWPREPHVLPVDRERDAARHAVAAILELSRDLFLPLEFGMFRCVTHDDDGAWITSRPENNDYWYLNTPDREPEPICADAVVIDVETVDASTMTTMVDDQLTEFDEGSTRRWSGWSEIHVHDTLARLPDSLAPTGDAFIVDDLDNNCRDLRVSVQRRDGGAWVGKPDLGFWTPISVVAVRDGLVSGITDDEGHYTTISLSIDVMWSVWWREGSPGRGVLDAAMDRLHQLGWTPDPE